MLIHQFQSIHRILVISIALTAMSSLFAKEKHALIIANGAYDYSSTGWMPLSSKNDIPLIKGALMSQGFESNNIAVTEDLNKARIIEEIEKLTNKVEKGDIVVIHYSGHGQQIFDDNGDETDGFDEALVAIDGPARYHRVPEYDGYGHLRDEKLGALIAILRGKLGKDGQVLIILDSCHSGTGTRGGFAKVRGGEPPFAPDGYVPTPNSNAEKEQGMGYNESGKSKESAEMSPFILYSGSSFDEQNSETEDANGNGVGSLSFAFSKAMTEVNNNDTYRSLFARIVEIMAEVAPHQTPMIEGNVDEGLFGGDLKVQEPFFKISSIESSIVEVEGGVVHGLTVGTTVKIYKSGTINPENEQDKLLQHGTVRKAVNFSSTIELEAPLELKNVSSAWVFIDETSFEDHKLKVSIGQVKDEKLQGSLRKELEQQNIISITEEGADLILREGSTSRGGTVIEMQAADYKLEKNVLANDVTGTVEMIKQYAQGSFLKGIHFQDPMYALQIEFIPVKVTQDKYGNIGKIDTLQLEDFNEGIVPSFPVGTSIMIKVINNGTQDAYFNILDIQPDGGINPVLPNSHPSIGITPKECFVRAGRSYVVPNFYLNIGPPYGLEVFKVFATKDPVDLEPIALRSGAQSRGSLDELSLFFNDVYGSTRGTQPFTSGNVEGTSANFNFNIVK